MKFLIALEIIILSLNFTAHASKESKTSRAGGHYAVTEFNKEEGFKLSEKSLKTMQIEFTTIKGNTNITIPKSALVTLKHTTGVYRRFEGWINFAIVKIQKKKGQEIEIT